MSSKRKPRLKSVATFPFPPDFNMNRDVVRSNIRASETYIVPVKPSLTGVKKISGSIVLAENTHEFYGFNSRIWTPFKTPPVGIAQVLAAGNDANGLSIVGLNILDANSITTNIANVQSMSVGSISLGGDLNMGGNSIVGVNYLNAGEITATLLVGNLSDFERSVSVISTDVIDTLIDFNNIGFNWANRVGGGGDEIATAVAMNDNNSIVLVGTYDATLNIYNVGGRVQVQYSVQNVYAGGFFTTAGGNTANRIGVFTTQQFNDNITEIWSGLSSGLNSQCRAITVDSFGNIYAGGAFTDVGNRIAKWDATSWSPLGTGLNSVCNAIATHPSGDVYVGGTFTNVGNRIAKWDPISDSWSPLGVGLNNQCRAIAVHPSGDIYVVGDFTSTFGGPAGSLNRIAKWDPMSASWSPLGSGLVGIFATCLAIAIDSIGNVYAGGTFSIAGGNPASRIAKWDPISASWFPLGSGLNGQCLAIAIHPSGDIYVGGDFNSTVGGPVGSLNGIAKWDPISASWSPLGGGLDFTCRAIAIDSSGDVYVGGGFSNVGTGIAKWDPISASWSPLGSGLDGECHAIAINTTTIIKSNGPQNSFITRYASKEVEYSGISISKGNPVWFARIIGNNEIHSVSISDLYYAFGSDSGFYRSDITVGLSFTLATFYDIDNTYIASYSSGTLASIITKYVEIYYDETNLNFVNILWLSKLLGNDIVQVNSTATDNLGAAIATGKYLANPLEIYDGYGSLIATLENSGNEDAFIVSYGAGGNYAWSSRLASPQTDVGTFVAVNKIGADILVTGYYKTSPLLIYNASGLLLSALQSVGVENIFLVKYDNLGGYQWGSILTGPGTQYRSACVDVNDIGNVILVGNYSGTLNIYNIFNAPVLTMPCSSTFGDAFIAKYDSTGGSLLWATRVSSAQQEMTSVSVNNVGEIVVTGYFSDAVLNIYDVPGTVLVATIGNSGSKDAYVLKYATNGTFVNFTRIVSANAKTESGKAISLNNLGDLVVAGTYTNTPSYLEIYDSLNTLVSTLPFDAGTDSFLVCYNNSTALSLGNPALDGQLKSIESSAQTVFVYPESSVNSARKAIRLQTNQSITMLWDAVEMNWIVLDNTGTLV